MNDIHKNSLTIQSYQIDASSSVFNYLCFWLEHVLD